jgi:hypothetical protein
MVGVEVEGKVGVAVESTLSPALDAETSTSGIAAGLGKLVYLCLTGLGGGGVGGLGKTTGKRTPKLRGPVSLPPGLLLLTLPPLTLLILGESLPLALAPPPIFLFATASLSTSSLTPPLRNPDPPLSWDARWRRACGGVSCSCTGGENAPGAERSNVPRAKRA